MFIRRSCFKGSLGDPRGERASRSLVGDRKSLHRRGLPQKSTVLPEGGRRKLILSVLMSMRFGFAARRKEFTTVKFVLSPKYPLFSVSETVGKGRSLSVGTSLGGRD